MHTLILSLITSLTFTEPVAEKNAGGDANKKKTERAFKEPEKETVPKVKVDNVVQDVFYVLTNSQEEGVALQRVAAASKIDVAKLKAVTVSDMTSGRLPLTLSGGDAINCNGAPVSMSRVRMLVQKGENELAYLELERAASNLKSASSGLPCLNESVDLEVAQRLYYLEGVVKGQNEDKAGAKESFKRALTFQPNMKWDEDIDDTDKPLFEEAKKEAAKIKEEAITVYPSSIQNRVWADGVALSADTKLSKGKHLIQVDYGQFASTVVDIDATGQMTLVVPGAIPANASSWVQENAKRKELGLIFDGLLEPESVFFVHNAGNVWIKTTTKPDWKELDVPKTMATSGLDPKKIAGQTLFWSGLTAVALGGSIAGINGVRANDARSVGESTDDWSVHVSNQATFDNAKNSYNVGLGILIGGAIVTPIGYWLTQ